MIEPTETDIGRMVIYRNLGGHGKIEEGVISSFTDNYVFVRYGMGPTAAATRHKDLEWSYRSPDETAIKTLIQAGKVTQIDFCKPPMSISD